MSAAVSEFAAVPIADRELAPYRAISRSAVLSAVLAGLSLPLVTLAVVSMTYDVGDAVPLGYVGAMFAVPAFVLGLMAGRTIRRYPTEYTGSRLAKSGLVGGLLLAATGIGVASYTHATEVPPGFTRVGFWELQPDPDEPGLPISPKAIELTGQKVFIKGYMHPGVASMGRVNNFILVRDMGTCCFGGQPKPTDMIEIHVPDDNEKISYSRRCIKLSGTFYLADHPTQALGLNNVWYHLEATEVK
jgi:hypothetical protein